jgi:hypothetical protein
VAGSGSGEHQGDSGVLEEVLGGPEVVVQSEVPVEEGGRRLTALAIFATWRCGTRMKEGSVTGGAWHMGTAVLEAALIGGGWWLAAPRKVISRVTEQRERWGARRGGKGLGFNL